MNRSLLFGIVALLFLTVGSFRVYAQPDWQKNIDWAIGNTGAPDCPEQYQYPECLLPGKGNRSCIMQKGIQSAKDGDCDNALRQALTSQCHNGGAQQSIGAAGKDAVCSYMKSK